MVTTLKRMENLETLPKVVEQTDFAKDCTSLLKYELPQLEVTFEQDSYALLQACVKAGVRPFETNNVKAYMAEKKRRSDRFGGYASICFFLVLFGLFATIATTIAAFTEGIGWYWPALSALVVFTCGVGLPYSEKRTGRQWNEYGLRFYTEPVPTGVLKKAIALKKTDGRITFVVHAFERNHQMSDDPFLSARLGAAEFFVAQWDEPSFDAAYD